MVNNQNLSAKGLVQSRSIPITNPTAASDRAIWEVPSTYVKGITITRVSIISLVGTVTGALNASDTNGLNPDACHSDISSVVGTKQITTTFTNATVAAGCYVSWLTTSVASSPTYCLITFEFTVN